MPQRWAVVVLVGPGELEAPRVADLFDSLAVHEPDVGAVVIVDDGADLRRDLLGLAGELADRTKVVALPKVTYAGSEPERLKRAWSDGVLRATLAGLRATLDDSSIDWVLRLDTDSLLIGRFAESISKVLGDDVGIVGTLDRFPDGSPRDFSGWGKAIRKFCMPLSVWRIPRLSLRSSLVGRGRERCRIVRSALGHGYRWGEHCQGGGFAISKPAIELIRREGWLDHSLWAGSGVGEDVIVSLLVRAVGLGARGMVDPGEPFAVQHVGLPGTPEQLVAAGYGVAHSLKSVGDVSEDDLRERFRALRQAD